ncbi:hypothetical protein L1987_49456 [Smallanthus sonchifolius]|uniref:Uncharacterized protein n=1 Tax=Smallanthus sonchifolius TaxID=185202 RepID=A0ACB9FU66_9ASTR|nr:hypothetical protein L1987_49456 [Smallanthus sonchifolius]
MSVGTEITHGNAMVPDEGLVDFLNHKWDKKTVTEEISKFPELTLQSETEQSPHKASFYVKKEKAQEIMKNLSESLVKRGVLYDIGVVSTKELFKCVINQGIILGEVQYMASKDQDGNFVSVKFLHWESIHTKGYQRKSFSGSGMNWFQQHNFGIVLASKAIVIRLQVDHVQSPWDREGLLKRLATFKSMTWFAKPQVRHD